MCLDFKNIYLEARENVIFVKLGSYTQITSKNNFRVIFYNLAQTRKVTFSVLFASMGEGVRIGSERAIQNGFDNYQFTWRY